MKLGFTGPQCGMTAYQAREFRRLVIELDPSEFHHGDCIGSDEEAVAIVADALPLCTVVCHPPRVNAKRAFTVADITRGAADYMTRNQAIVDACDKLIATPGESYEVRRSGTWSTIRRARRRGIPVILVTP